MNRVTTLETDSKYKKGRLQNIRARQVNSVLIQTPAYKKGPFKNRGTIQNNNHKTTWLQKILLEHSVLADTSFSIYVYITLYLNKSTRVEMPAWLPRSVVKCGFSLGESRFTTEPPYTLRGGMTVYVYARHFNGRNWWR